MSAAISSESSMMPATIVPSATMQRIHTVAILGAGVMGAQIAAQCVNAGLTTYLFELPAEGDNLNARVQQAIAQLAKADPPPLATAAHAQLIHAANYQRDLPRLSACDLVIEAIAERMDLKQALYQQIVPFLAEHTILATNTSGLPLTVLSKELPPPVQSRFCGIHFFNPPRYMHLVELTPTPHTQPALLDVLETFLVAHLGKGVLRAKPTPNFIANRLGLFSLMATLHHADRFQLPFDVVDALTGSKINRPNSATFRTVDLVGLDTLIHVIQGTAQALRGDPWQSYYQVPDWLQYLVQQGALGQKTGAGVYRKTKAGIEVLDLTRQAYRPADSTPDAALKDILKQRDWGQKLPALRACEHPQAQFLWAVHRDIFHYAAYWLADIADSARDVDLALRWGFGWALGPFEIWQAAGWQSVTEWLQAEIADGQTLGREPLPAWVSTVQGVHQAAGSWSPKAQAYQAPSDLAVYQRQYFPASVLGGPRPSGVHVVYETDAVRLWHRGDDIAILSFLTKMHTISPAVLTGLQAALAIAERDFIALVLWQPEAPFSAGADLSPVAPVVQQGDFAAIEMIVQQFQQASLRLRSVPIPVVAAVQGLAIGGGCEFLMHCDRVVAALNSYIGLVEVGIGFIPAGAGCKEIAARAAAAAPDYPFLLLKDWIMRVGTGTVANSAYEAKAMGFLRDGDVIIMNPDELLHVACQQARTLAEANYQPPQPLPIKVAGRDGIANANMQLVNMRDGGFISAHDYEIGVALATVLCGGEVESGSEVSPDWLLQLERTYFMRLLQTEKTLARVMHMLQTGKPLRN